MTRESSTPRGMSRLGFLASPASEVEDSKPTRIRMAMVDWKSMADRLWGQVMEKLVGWAHCVAPRGFLIRNMIARMLKPTSETSWMMLMAMEMFVLPVMPRTAMKPTKIENRTAMAICQGMETVTPKAPKR